ncbi:MAG: ATPase domain-containing protein [Anaerolineae bacterium]|nr:ATPase domain-containing protein [Anaerolineae bacterium]
MERIPTHVPNLDEILHGGLPLHSTVLISGVPGSGKTILATQIAYGNATPQNKALMVTTVSEPLARIIQYTQQFSFFELEKVGSAVIYEDIGPLVLEGNGEKALAHVTELALQHQPALLIVDSFKAIHDLAESEAGLRRALYQLAASLAALPCTTLLVGEYVSGDLFATPEATMVDGIIELTNQPIGLRDHRSLRVRKLRGSDYRAGEHAFHITADGLVVFPRFVTPPTPLTYAVSAERAATGIPGLDEMLHGGLLRGTTTLVAGDPGAGKTVTALHFLLNGALQGEPGAYISFQEDPNQLAQIARNFGFDLEALRAQGLVAMFYTSPVELDVDEHILKIVETIERVGARRVVIDSVSVFEAGTVRDPNRYFNYVYSLVQWFKNHGVTAMLTYERSEMFGGELVLTGTGVSHIADNAIVMRYVRIGSEMRRAITVLKARGSEHSKEVREYLISEKEGPRVGELIADVGFRIAEKRSAIRNPQ